MLTITLLCLAAASTDGVPSTPRGDYVEARTAAVFTGPCHHGAQHTTQGREALLGWHFEVGRHDGVSLAGIDLVVALAADRNLDEVQAQRVAVVYLDADADARTRSACLAWLRAEHPGLLGELVAVRVEALDDERRGEAFRIALGEHGLVRGALLPERECCTMPYMRWYDPFVAVRDAVVGCNEVFRYRGPELRRSFSRSGENDVFVGRFGPPPPELVRAER